jgi:outer membrane protein OmpA-like peptidoglycan-associated protein
MSNSCFIRKFFCLWLFLATVNAAADNLNIYGQSGIHKTQSGKTLGHGRFGLGFLMEGSGINNIIENEQFCLDKQGNDCAPISSYIGGNLYVALSLGLSNFFDFSLSIPVYGEYLRLNNGEGHFKTDNFSAGGWGDLRLSTKFRVPFGEEFPLDIALVPSFSIATGRTALDVDEVNGYGPWVRDPAFLNVNEDVYGKGAEGYSPLAAGAPSTYTNASNAFKIGAAATFDFNKLKGPPLIFHLNWGYRMVLGDGANDYPSIQNIAVALELTPAEFLTFFGEFYTDMPSAFPNMTPPEKDSPVTPVNLSPTDLSTATLGASFHLSKNVDIQVGTQILLGDESKYVRDLKMPLGNGNYANYNSRLIPKYLVFGGLTVQLFVIEPEKVWEEDYRNPDTDEDEVCDPWVRQTGREHEFTSVCTGLDRCPYDPGPIENRGCPEEEEEEEEDAEPTIIFNVSQESIVSGQFATLSWITTNATEVEIEGLGVVSAKGSMKVKPSETTTYTITATGPGGTKTETLEIIVESGEGPSIIFNANQESVQPGQTVTLTWMVSDATEVSIEGIGSVPAKGSRKVKIYENTSYTLTAVGEGGTRTETVEVMVESAPLPVIIFTASSESVQKGQNVTLNWNVTNATEVKLEGIGTVSAQGSRRVKMTESKTFTLSAMNQGGTQTATVEVEVDEPPPIEKKVNLKGVNFLSGKSELTLDAKRVLDDVVEQLLASPEVKIEIHGHTDNQGNAKSNQDLSERRAKAVVGYLASKGVRANRMRALGFGQDSPIADNATAAGREQNRRIEMIRVD